MYKYVALVLAIFFAEKIVAQEKVQVSVYYESLCPDSIKFFTKQLYPALQHNLSRYIDLKLVPYGKASQNYNDQGIWEFQCHHGPNECYGNKVQACAISKIDNGHTTSNLGYNKITVAFINCLMDKVVRDPFDLPIRSCATLNNVQNVAEIESCTNHTDGTNLLSNLGHITEKLQPKLTSVPTIVFNNVYNKNDNDLSQTNFPKALCSYIRTNKPAECLRNGAEKISYSLLTLVLAIFTVRNIF